MAITKIGIKKKKLKAKNMKEIVLFYVLLTVHLDTSAEWKPTWCAIYPQFVSSVNLYMFRAYL